MKYALIGEKLGHSFSGIIHRGCGLEYDLVELGEDELERFVRSGKYAGFNVTIPYKKSIMPYLDQVDQGAQDVGAVNTVVIKDGKSIGYNTDVIGLSQMIDSTGISLSGRHVVVLGTGGASCTAQAVARRAGARKVSVVSRSGELNYGNAYEVCADAEVIINTTPVGMYPDVESCPVEVERLGSLVAVFDCVYNPIRTALVERALSLGITARGGLSMLIGQAIEAQKIWGVCNEQLAENTAKHLASQMNNVVLSGMAGCGKSTVGKAVAKALSKPFFDTDEEIFARVGKTAEEIISEQGEPAFRQIEAEVVRELAKAGGRVISLGGGAVLREQNVLRLKQNGIIIYIERDPSKLSTEGRPISRQVGVEALFARRKSVYEGTCDARAKNEGTVDECAEEVIRLYEDISHKRS